jgi:hypothetical protein
VSGFTRIGCLFFDWEPMTLLDPVSIKLWLVVYLCKRYPPGLWKGTVVSLASDARLPVADTDRSLDRLCSFELAQYDCNAQVLRLTKFPDAGEWPSSPLILKSWWSRFQQLPRCAVRDAHVQLLRWLLETGAAQAEKNRSKRVSPGHEDVWMETFGTITAPLRVTMPLNDARYDTSTAHQPSLFAPRNPTPNGSPDPSGAARSGSESENHQINNSEYLSGTPSPTGEGEGEGVGVGSFSSPEGEGMGGGRPALRIVRPPADAPFTVDALRAVLQPRGVRVSELQALALADAIRDLGALPAGEKTLELLERWTKLRVDEAVVPGKLRIAILYARQREEEAEERSQALREVIAAVNLATGNGGGETVH